MALRSTDARYVLLDGRPVGCDRAGDSRADYSGMHRRHGVNRQVITAPDGTLVWISPALPGRAPDLTAARRHRITATCIRLGIPVLAGKAYRRLLVLAPSGKQDASTAWKKTFGCQPLEALPNPGGHAGFPSL